MASQASIRSLGSSSVFSVGRNLSQCFIVKRDEDSDSVESCNAEKHYNLQDLWKCELQRHILPKDNDNACELYLKAILGASSYNYKTDEEIENLNNLPPLLCSTKQRPDVQILHNNQILTTIEVHSSKSYEATIEKSIMTVVELLRLKRSFNENITSCTGFTFPKQPDNYGQFNQCVVKIKVIWTGLKFLYTLTNIVNIHDVKVAVVDVCNTACLECYTGQQRKKYTVVLSTTELESIFGTGAIQMPSISSTLVFVPDERIWYKSPHGVLEVLTYMTLKMKEITSLSYTINFDICSKQGLHVVKYKTVLHDPLKIEEARLCLMNFVREVAEILEQYHKKGYAHQDVRLENICFNDQYQPVLIDLDRSIEITEPVKIHGNSCMYVPKMLPSQVDFIQLGWLAAWVLHPGDKYHTRKFNNLPENMQSDQFIRKLIKEGVYKDQYLGCSMLTNYQFPLREIILQRKQPSIV